MSKSPTPSERERSDKLAREREAEEQALLPYRWTQTIKDVDVTVPVRGTLKGKDIVVVISKTNLKVGVRGEEPTIDVCGGGFSHTRKFPLGESVESFPQLMSASLFSLGPPLPRRPRGRMYLDARIGPLRR